MTEQPKREPLILAPTHLSITAYATKKNVSRAAVYTHIRAGTIVPDLVGEARTELIDWTLYKDNVFAEPKWSVEKFKEKLKKEADDATKTDSTTQTPRGE